MKQPSAPRAETAVWSGKPSMLTAMRKALTESYTVTTERIKISYGLLNKQTEEIELFRVQDLSVTRTLWDRMFGVGNIVITSGDASGSTTVLHDIKDAEAIKDKIRAASRVERQRHRVGVFEETYTEEIPQ